MRDSTTGIIIVGILVLIIGIGTVLILHNNGAHENNNNNNGTIPTNNKTNTTVVTYIYNTIIVYTKDGNVLYGIAIVSDRLRVEVPNTYKLKKLDVTGTKVKYKIVPSENVSYDEFIGNIKLYDTVRKKYINPKFVKIDFTNDETVINGNLFSVTRYSNDLYNIVKSIIVNSSEKYGTLTIYDIINKRYIYNGGITINNGRIYIAPLQNILKGKQGSFSITIKVRTNAESVIVFVGSLTTINVDRIGGYIKVLRDYDKYYIKVPKTYDGYKYVLSFNDNVFTGSLNSISDGRIYLPIDYVKRVLNGEKFYIMLTKGDKYYKSTISSPSGGVIYIENITEGHVILPNVVVKGYTFDREKNFTEVKNVPITIVYVSPKPTVLKVYDGETYNEIKDVIQKTVTVGNLVYYTLYFSVDFNHSLHKVYIKDVTNDKMIPIALDYYYYKQVSNTTSTLDDVLVKTYDTIKLHSYVINNVDGYRVVLLDDENIKFNLTTKLKYIGECPNCTNVINNVSNNSTNTTEGYVQEQFLFTPTKTFKTYVIDGTIYYLDDFTDYIMTNGTGDVYASTGTDYMFEDTTYEFISRPHDVVPVEYYMKMGIMVKKNGSKWNFIVSKP